MNFDPPLPLPLIVLLAGLAVAVACWREVSGKRRLHPRWLHGFALLFRLGAVAILILILLNPSRPMSSPVEIARQGVILLDASASMNLAAESGNRWQEARAFADDLSQRVASSGLPTPRLLTFSGSLDIGAPAADATGRQTNLGTAIEGLFSPTSEEYPPEIFLLSDGRLHDRDRLEDALVLANAARVPIFTRSFGIDSPPRNARLVAVQAPRMVRPRSPVSVHVDIGGVGIAPGEALQLTLTDEEGTVVAATECYLAANRDSAGPSARPTSEVLVFESGLRTGRYQVALTVGGEPEVDLDDNRFAFTVEIATGKLRVLFAEGTHWKRTVGTLGHCWNDMELMTRAWEATGEIEHVSLTPWSQYLNEPNLAGVTFHNGEMKLDRTKDFPKTREELYAFDVVIVSDVPEGNFSAEQMQWVVDLVEKRGGGFLMGGGNTTFDSGQYDKTPWEKIVPVDMVAWGHGHYRGWFDIEIPESVRQHPLWTVSPDPRENAKILAAHPQFTGMNLVKRPKPGALVLAHVQGGDEPVIVAQRYGRGRSVAFMPDPNGGGGTFYLDWGPVDSPVLSAEVRHIDLGHGRGFRFNETVAHTDYGPEPSHPSPWYAQYWVNMVRWLGENSVRWQRDKFLARVHDAQAHPGKDLSVAAEVLEVVDTDALLALDVGARLDLPGARRTRLLYDRDRREFRGELVVPAELDDRTEVGVLFDAQVSGNTLSQEIRVGVHRGNPEFRFSSPDPVFLADLAEATGGAPILSAEDALDSLRERERERRQGSTRLWNEPSWTDWWPWILLAVFLSLEWSVRRRGHRPLSDGGHDAAPVGDPLRASAVSLAVLFATFTGIPTASGEDDTSIAHRIDQLGADRVRLRDEAESRLREMPNAYKELETFLQSGENQEAKIRAENILRHLRSQRWQLVATRLGHSDLGNTFIFDRALVIAPNRSLLYSRARDFVRDWNPGSYEPLESFGEPSFNIKEAWLTEGIARTLAVSPDSKSIAATNEFGEVILYDRQSRKETLRLGPKEAESFRTRNEPWLEGIVMQVDFHPDRRRLVSGFRRGVRMWDLERKKMLWENRFGDPAFSVVLSPDRRHLLVCGDPPRANDPLYVLDANSGETLAEIELPTRLGGLSFDSTGTRLVGFGRDGFARLYDYDPATGTLSNERSYGPNSNECQGVTWGPDETTILVTSWNPEQAMTEWDLETAEAIWKAPPIEIGLCTPVWIDTERIAVLGAKGYLTFWKFMGE